MPQAVLTSLRNPRWSNFEKTQIDCEITTSQFGSEVLPFTAASFDVEPHGQQIFADIVSGKYGPIADYISDSLPQETVANFNSPK